MGRRNRGKQKQQKQKQKAFSKGGKGTGIVHGPHKEKYYPPKKKKHRVRSEWDLFNEELREQGLNIHDTVADGNCFFRSLSDQLFGQESRHSECRKKIVSYMSHYRDEFEPFIIGDYSSYLRKMSHSGSWAGQTEVTAASRVYRLDITLHQLGFASYQILCPPMETLLETDDDDISYHKTSPTATTDESVASSIGKQIRSSKKKKKKSSSLLKTKQKEDTSQESSESKEGDDSGTTKEDCFELDTDDVDSSHLTTPMIDRIIRTVHIAYCDGKHYASVRPSDASIRSVLGCLPSKKLWAPVDIFSSEFYGGGSSEADKMAAAQYRRQLAGFRDGPPKVESEENPIDEEESMIVAEEMKKDDDNVISESLLSAVDDDGEGCDQEKKDHSKGPVGSAMPVDSQTLDESMRSLIIADDAEIKSEDQSNPDDRESCVSETSDLAFQSDPVLSSASSVAVSHPVSSSSLPSSKSECKGLKSISEDKSSSSSLMSGDIAKMIESKKMVPEGEDPLKAICKCGSMKKWAACCGRKMAKQLKKERKRAKNKGSKKMKREMRRMKKQRALDAAAGMHDGCEEDSTQTGSEKKKRKKKRKKEEQEFEDLYDGARISQRNRNAKGSGAPSLLFI